MNVGSAIIMPAVVGQTVKPGRVPNRQIRDIPVRIWCCWAVPAGGYGGIWLRNRRFPALCNGVGAGSRLRVGLPTLPMEPVHRGMAVGAPHDSSAIAKPGRTNDAPPAPAKFPCPGAPRKSLVSLSLPWAFAEFQPPGGSVIVTGILQVFIAGISGCRLP
jgi:hypothetical protein